MAFQLPGSALVVLRSLARGGPMSPKEITSFTKLPSRTVSSAIKRLTRLHLLRRVPDLQDMRKCLYGPNLEVAREMVKSYGPDSMVAVQLSLILALR
ncbi:MAG: MarR family transcriptional regulator [Candidatus Thorarchaeota archaeon]|jgi:DNA-binding MarR family transcriptional regulator